ncbi:hypothetical protein B0H13DRAFT_1888824 [Mycena leptocephala]|nr:hypothetical protein B0H13DRAFT_1888824 [Mycena leptocephala]
MFDFHKINKFTSNDSSLGGPELVFYRPEYHPEVLPNFANRDPIEPFCLPFCRVKWQDGRILPTTLPEAGKQGGSRNGNFDRVDKREVVWIYGSNQPNIESEIVSDLNVEAQCSKSDMTEYGYNCRNRNASLKPTRHPCQRSRSGILPTLLISVPTGATYGLLTITIPSPSRSDEPLRKRPVILPRISAAEPVQAEVHRLPMHTKRPSSESGVGVAYTLSMAPGYSRTMHRSRTSSRASARSPLFRAAMCDEELRARCVEVCDGAEHWMGHGEVRRLYERGHIDSLGWSFGGLWVGGRSESQQSFDCDRRGGEAYKFDSRSGAKNDAIQKRRSTITYHALTRAHEPRNTAGTREGDDFKDATLINALQQTEKAAVDARHHTEERERQIETLRAQVADLTAKCATLDRDLATERRISAERAAALDAAEQTYRTERDEATEALALAATTIQSVAERRRVVAFTASPRKRNISLVDTPQSRPPSRTDEVLRTMIFKKRPKTVEHYSKRPRISNLAEVLVSSEDEAGPPVRRPKPYPYPRISA